MRGRPQPPTKSGPKIIIDKASQKNVTKSVILPKQTQHPTNSFVKLKKRIVIDPSSTQFKQQHQHASSDTKNQNMHHNSMHESGVMYTNTINDQEAGSSAGLVKAFKKQ